MNHETTELLLPLKPPLHRMPRGVDPRRRARWTRIRQEAAALGIITAAAFPAAYAIVQILGAR